MTRSRGDDEDHPPNHHGEFFQVAGLNVPRSPRPPALVQAGSSEHARFSRSLRGGGLPAQTLDDARVFTVTS